MKKTVLFAAFVMLVSAASPLHAQTGCANSPENPTILLALVGSAGAAVTALRGRFGK